MVFALDSSAVLVHLSNGDLDRGVVLCFDDAVGSAALSRDVATPELVALLLPRFSGRLQVDDVALIILHGVGCDWFFLAVWFAE